MNLETTAGAPRIKETNTSPLSILTLPTELVCEIFTHFLPTYPLCPSLIGSLSPTLLSHVCHEWREIAITMPAIWRAIAVSFDEMPVEGQLHIMDLWLKRSRGCPLSLEIIGEYPESASAAVALIVPHTARWEYVKLHGSPNDLHMIVGSLPLLRQLDLALDGPIGNPLSALDMPLLRTVALDFNYADQSPIALPWAQLTSLTIINTTPVECAPLLQRTPNLVHCELGLIYDDDDLEDITLPRLKSLILPGGGYYYLCAFLFILKVPSLRILRLPDNSLGDDPVTFLASFIAKSGCTLEELAITGTRSAERDAAYRQAFPSIPKLSFP
ncbi:hypothetical protein C8F04DRAFT_1146344 [Mycena alexandri]|uniref:F-box domain-containing protein n=1 Tax=Mycena alexandri TaxID=1745969 RepID=A0AAD6WP30_9AGAR|nr:hypothetical protein C8F04DRAFT_1146344 [Mycena alexandri]